MADNGESQNGGPIIAAERRRKIYDSAIRRGSVSVSEMAEIFGVRTQTIRNDLDALQQEGKLIRSYGGAVVKDTLVTPLPYSESRASHAEEKSAIGEAALRYLPEDDYGSVYIDSGTTNYQLALRIPESCRLRVVTTFPDIAAHLVQRTRADVLLLGGRIVPDCLATDYTASLEMIEKLYFNVAFVSASGIDSKHGITDIDHAMAQGLRLIMEHSSKVVMLCDSSKFGRISHVCVGAVSLIDVLITDSGADPEFVRHLDELGVQVEIAESRADERGAVL